MPRSQAITAAGGSSVANCKPSCCRARPTAQQMPYDCEHTNAASLSRPASATLALLPSGGSAARPNASCLAMLRHSCLTARVCSCRPRASLLQPHSSWQAACACSARTGRVAAFAHESMAVHAASTALRDHFAETVYGFTTNSL